MDFIKIKNLCFIRYTLKKIKKTATEWDKIYANQIFNKKLESTVY